MTRSAAAVADSVTAYSATTGSEAGGQIRPRSSRSASGSSPYAVKNAWRAELANAPYPNARSSTGSARQASPSRLPRLRPRRVHEHVPQVEVSRTSTSGSVGGPSPAPSVRQRVEGSRSNRTPRAVESQPVEGLAADWTRTRRRAASGRAADRHCAVPPAVVRAAGGGRHRGRQRAGPGRLRGAARRGPRRPGSSRPPQNGHG